MLIWKLTVSVIWESSALTKRFQKKMLEKLLSLLQLVCKIFKICGFKILFAVVTVSISVIVKNKSSTFSYSWVKTLNNKMLIGKKKLVKKVG